MGLPLAVPVGDPGGVGPVVALRAVAALEASAVLFGDADLLTRAARDLGLAQPPLVRDGQKPVQGGISICDTGRVEAAAVARHAPTVETGQAQWNALRVATDWMLEGRARALVTAPVSKEAITLAGHPFVGQTEYLAQRAGLVDDDVTMMFLGPRLRVSLATTHLALRDVPSAIGPGQVARATMHLAEALALLYPAERPRIAVTGLNPHAGEGGLFGDEDIRAIAPGIRAAAQKLAGVCDLCGPMPAEAAFRGAQGGELAGVVAMFHDQATIASKLLDWGRAVNVTWGLPFVRTSVDHGVAYDAARQNCASDEGMRAAVALALQLTTQS